MFYFIQNEWQKTFCELHSGLDEGVGQPVSCWGTNLYGMPIRHWNNQENGASKLRFLQKNEFLLKLATVLAPISKRSSALS